MLGHPESPAAHPSDLLRRVTSRLAAFLREHAPGRAAERVRIEEDIDEAGRESFPASDPPAWTLGVQRHERQP
jgi:hypothetical protein